jgi:rhomboid protease GluP
MENQSTSIAVLKENLFTRPPNHDAASGMTAMGFLLYVLSFLYFTGGYGSTHWMPATGASIFNRHEYWRLWTTLFAHGDGGHLLGNSVLFLPFAYLLTGYFGWFLFPFLGILMGGLINLIVLSNMPADTALIGISGVVYWMGATYITLHGLIDRRRSVRFRFAGALFVTLVLFVPDTYKAQVSYLSHFVGYILGVFSGLFYFFVYRKYFYSQEIWENVFDDSVLWDPEVISSGPSQIEAESTGEPGGDVSNPKTPV